MTRLSKNLEYLKPSETLAISQLAQQKRAAGEDVIDLSAGEPDFETPKIASDAGIRAIQQGKTHYPPNAGLLDLRAAAARHFSLLSGGRPVNADNFVVSTGAKQSLFNACFALFGSGDQVLVPAPYWVSYPQMLRFARAEPIVVPGAIEWSLKVGVDDLERASTVRTRGVILCSPVNPTGAVYTRAELKAIATWAREKDIWLIADEIYRRIHYGTGPAPSVLDLPDELLERTVLITGVSKAYAMTGWRVGLALAPNPVAKAMAGVQSHTTSGAAQPSQWAATAAFSDERIEEDVARMVEEFRHRRDLVVRHFRTHLSGVEFVEPVGAFYFFFRVDHLFNDDITGAAKFCEALLNTAGIALVPGEAFGDKRWVRLSYAASAHDLDQAMDRLSGFMRKG
jgi:aspartate aminotransferase